MKSLIILSLISISQLASANTEKWSCAGTGKSSSTVATIEVTDGAGTGAFGGFWGIGQIDLEVNTKDGLSAAGSIQGHDMAEVEIQFVRSKKDPSKGKAIIKGSAYVDCVGDQNISDTIKCSIEQQADQSASITAP